MVNPNTGVEVDDVDIEESQDKDGVTYRMILKHKLKNAKKEAKKVGEKKKKGERRRRKRKLRGIKGMCFIWFYLQLSFWVIVSNLSGYTLLFTFTKF